MKKFLQAFLLVLLLGSMAVGQRAGATFNCSLTTTGYCPVQTGQKISTGGIDTNNVYIIPIGTPGTITVTIDGSVKGDFTDSATCGSSTSTSPNLLSCSGIYTAVRVHLSTFTGFTSVSLTYWGTSSVAGSTGSLPNQSGQGGKFLTTNGSVTSWSNPAGSGNTTGAASSTTGDVTLFADTTGKVLAESNFLGANIAKIQTCTNKLLVSVDHAATVANCITVTSAYIDTSIPHTGVDINTSSQVTVTHLASPLTVAQGGTGVGAGTANKVFGGSGPGYVTINSSYTDTSLAITGVDIDTSGDVIATHLATPLPVLQGGTGTASPGLVAGTNVTVTGTWPNQTINSTGGGGGGGDTITSPNGTIAVGGTATNTTLDVTGVPMTTLGDMLYGGALGTPTRLAGATGINGIPYTLVSSPSAGAAQAPVWQPSGSVPNPQTGTTYTVLATDRSGYITFSNASAIAVTLPAANSSGFTTNFYTSVKNIGAGTVTITPTTSTIDGGSMLVLLQGESCTVRSDNANYFSTCGSGKTAVTSPVTVTRTAAGDNLGCTSCAVTGVDINSSNQVIATHLASALPVNQGGTGTGSTLIGVMRGNSTAMNASEMSGDCATSGSNSLTCTKTNGVAFAASATTDTTNAFNITTGTIGAPRLPLALSSSTSVNSTTIPASSTLVVQVATGSSTMGTGAITSGTCATVVTTSATGTTTTGAGSHIVASPSADPTGITGYGPSASGSLYVQAWPTANNVNFKVCNNTSGSITPAALTFNWVVY